MTEELPFELVAKLPGFEVRLYPKHVLVQVVTKGEFNSAASQAFRPLVNYISGRNISGEKFAMTAPVLHAPADELHTVSFVLPEGVKLKDLPVPMDAQVSAVQVKEHYAAAVRFRGLADYEHFKAYGDKLLQALKDAKLKPAGDPYYARFDPPWKPGFLRRNEAIIDLTEYQSKGKK